MIDGAGLLGVEMGLGGIALSDNRRGVRLFKITSGSNPYAASEVWLNESSGATAVTGVYDLTAAQNQLWEVNGNTSVPANTIVEAVPNPAGNGFWFSWQAAAAQAPPDLKIYHLNTSFTLTAATTVWEDVMTFTPTVTGYVTFSVHCHFQSTAVGDYLEARVEGTGLGGTTVVPGATFGTIQEADVFTRPSLFAANSFGTSGLTWKLQVRRVYSGTPSNSTVLGSSSGRYTHVTILPFTGTAVAV